MISRPGERKNAGRGARGRRENAEITFKCELQMRLVCFAILATYDFSRRLPPLSPPAEFYTRGPPRARSLSLFSLYFFRRVGPPRASYRARTRGLFCPPGRRRDADRRNILESLLLLPVGGREWVPEIDRKKLPGPVAFELLVLSARVFFCASGEMKMSARPRIFAGWMRMGAMAVMRYLIFR